MSSRIIHLTKEKATQLALELSIRDNTSTIVFVDDYEIDGSPIYDYSRLDHFYGSEETVIISFDRGVRSD